MHIQTKIRSFISKEWDILQTCHTLWWGITFCYYKMNNPSWGCTGSVYCDHASVLSKIFLLNTKTDQNELKFMFIKFADVLNCLFCLIELIECFLRFWGKYFIHIEDKSKLMNDDEWILLCTRQNRWAGFLMC